MDNIEKNQRDMIIDKLFKEILMAPAPKKITPSMTMSTFIPDKRFETEFKQMFKDKISRVFNIASGDLGNKTIVELIQLIEKRISVRQKFGNKPFKRR